MEYLLTLFIVSFLPPEPIPLYSTLCFIALYSDISME